MIGRTLAVFSIESRLSGGGMGEVCRARDTRLGRRVPRIAEHLRAMREWSGVIFLVEGQPRLAPPYEVLKEGRLRH